MAFSTRIKDLINAALRPAGFRLDTLTAERAEAARLDALTAAGYYEQPAFPLLPAFAAMDPAPLLAECQAYRERFDSFADAAKNEVGFSYDNHFFSPVDTEILYTLVRRLAPSRILEIGCGNSTRISRQAILDGKLATRLICVDPCPRIDVAGFADELHRHPVEHLPSLELFESLVPGDILFIDSSHEFRSGNDCAFLYLRALPRVAPGVVIHVHDIFLPYDYPAKHPATVGWSEQYVLQTLLAQREAEVFWSSYHLLQKDPSLRERFHRDPRQLASASCWLRFLS